MQIMDLQDLNARIAAVEAENKETSLLIQQRREEAGLPALEREIAVQQGRYTELIAIKAALEAAQPTPEIAALAPDPDEELTPVDMTERRAK